MVQFKLKDIKESNEKSNVIKGKVISEAIKIETSTKFKKMIIPAFGICWRFSMNLQVEAIPFKNRVVIWLPNLSSVVFL